MPTDDRGVRFKTVSAADTPAAMARLVELWTDVNKEQSVHPLITLAGFNLDFLCIHSFRDGNGRVSRLLLLLQCYHLGFEVGRYISLERIVEDNKDRYYETLGQCSKGWHEGKHDPWPFIGHLLFVLREAYREFERRVGQIKSPRGAKTALIEDAIAGTTGTFTLTDLEQICPGVSRDMIRLVIRKLQKDSRAECLGRGPGAAWQKLADNTKKPRRTKKR